MTPPSSIVISQAEKSMYKNRLQEYAQKSGFPLPTYETVNQGFQHAPMFRGSVLVNGQRYVSSEFFIHKKEAEQDAAKFALECISKTANDDLEIDIIYEDVKCCKSIIYEFAVKMNMACPSYRTVLPDCRRAVYISTLTLNGDTFTGQVAKSKKEAAQLAAQSAIQSLLETDSGVLREIIKSKAKLYGATEQNSNVPVVIKPASSPQQQIPFIPPAAGCPLNDKRKAEDIDMEQKRMRST